MIEQVSCLVVRTCSLGNQQPGPGIWRREYCMLKGKLSLKLGVFLVD